MVFTGTEILFFVLGIITTLFIVTLIKYNKELKFNVWAFITLILGAFLFTFTLAWTVSSVLEGVPRSASMGLVVFGVPSLILLLLGRRIALKNGK